MDINERDLAQPTIADLVFNDVDELTQNLTGWEGDWNQLDAGQSQNRIEVVAGQHAIIQRYHFSHSIHQRGKPPSEWLTFGFNDRQSPMKWCGNDVTAPIIADFNGESGFECVSRREFQAVTVSISAQEFFRTADKLGLLPQHFGSANLPLPLSDGDAALHELPRYLNSLLARSKAFRSSYSARQFAASELDEELPVRILTALAGSRFELDDLPLKSRQKGLRLAIEFIEANCQLNISIPDICAAANLSWRSLDRAFKESFGIGPKRYLLNFKLTQVRRHLKSAPPNMKVADIANDWGYWHMGDFAREYRRMFGELPTETLKRL